ncbi:MAG TPA: hypothetical protein VHZ74_24460 [Bryobacteraceae bacterium]|nr:hypothetical protein [Bryobacteraceae bacterium]
MPNLDEAKLNASEFAHEIVIRVAAAGRKIRPIFASSQKVTKLRSIAGATPGLARRVIAKW